MHGIFKPFCHYALVTLLERKQRVHTLSFFEAPFTTALTFLIFGFQVLLLLLWEWLTFIPKTKPFPQTSHFAITTHLLITYRSIVDIQIHCYCR